MSDDAIEAYADNWNEGVRGITIAHRVILVEGMDRARTIYEAARAKDAERIEQLEAAAKAVVERWHSPAWKYADPHTGVLIDGLAKAAGFTPTEP